MKMSGEFDPVYVLARRVLLDTLEALGPQREALVLVGAHAVYLHAGEMDLAVSPFTRDVDIVLDPSLLLDEPLLQTVFEKASFRAGEQPGVWLSAQNVPVDLLVPAAVGGPGKRGARLGVHGKKAARKVFGMEGALVDKSVMTLSALDSSDKRTLKVQVAGPAALLVSKTHKIHERLEQPDRLRDKDALDVYRLLNSVPTGQLSDAFEYLLTVEFSAEVVKIAIQLLRKLFSTNASPGIKMLKRVVTPFEDGEFRAQACMRLVLDLLDSIK